MSESERPPVDPLREALEEIRDGYPIVFGECLWCMRSVGDGRNHEPTCASAIARAALASPAVPGWPRCQDGYDLRTEVCPVCSPAAPRPEGLDVDADEVHLARAASHMLTHLAADAPTFYCEDTTNVRHFAAAILARLSDTGDTAPRPEGLDVEDVERVLSEVWERGGRERRAGQAVIELVDAVFSIRTAAVEVARLSDTGDTES